MNQVALLILKDSSLPLISLTEQLDYEPSVHLLSPHVVSGKTKIVLTPWPEYTDDQHILLWDNLRSHCTNQVYQRVIYRPEGMGRFDIVRRPPYQPKFGPTEYVFCMLACKLQDQVKNIDTDLPSTTINRSQRVKKLNSRYMGEDWLR